MMRRYLLAGAAIVAFAAATAGAVFAFDRRPRPTDEQWERLKLAAAAVGLYLGSASACDKDFKPAVDRYVAARDSFTLTADQKSDLAHRFANGSAAGLEIIGPDRKALPAATCEQLIATVARTLVPFEP